MSAIDFDVSLERLPAEGDRVKITSAASSWLSASTDPSTWRLYRTWAGEGPRAPRLTRSKNLVDRPSTTRSGETIYRLEAAPAAATAAGLGAAATGSKNLVDASGQRPAAGLYITSRPPRRPPSTTKSLPDTPVGRLWICVALAGLRAVGDRVEKPG